MIWKCIYFCNLPKSVFPTLCQFVPSEAKLSDCQRECSNLPYSAFYPIILLKNGERKEKIRENYLPCNIVNKRVKRDGLLLQTEGIAVAKVRHRDRKKIGR